MDIATTGAGDEMVRNVQEGIRTRGDRTSKTAVEKLVPVPGIDVLVSLTKNVDRFRHPKREVDRVLRWQPRVDVRDGGTLSPRRFGQVVNRWGVVRKRRTGPTRIRRFQELPQPKKCHVIVNANRAELVAPGDDVKRFGECVRTPLKVLSIVNVRCNVIASQKVRYI